MIFVELTLFVSFRELHWADEISSATGVLVRGSTRRRPDPWWRRVAQAPVVRQGTWQEGWSEGDLFLARCGELHLSGVRLHEEQT